MSGWTLEEALRLGRGDERPFLCHVHGDTNPSASVSMTKKVWYCYTCHAHGRLKGEALLMEPDYYAMARKTAAQIEQKTYSESWLNQFDSGPVHPYWLERFDETTARRFRLGYDRAEDAGTYPLRDVAGRVLGVVRRPFSGDGPKYRYPYGVDISRLLFNYSPGKQAVVVLVEGAMDSIAWDRAGVEAWGVYGSKLSDPQVTLINRAEPELVVCSFDQDRAGWICGQEAERKLRHFPVINLSWPKFWGKDPDEVGTERLQKIWGQVLQTFDCGVV